MESEDSHITLTEDNPFQFNFKYIASIVVLTCLVITTFLYITRSEDPKTGVDKTDKKETNYVQPEPSTVFLTKAPVKTWYIELTDDPNLSNLQHYISPSPTLQNSEPPILIAGDRPPVISGNIMTPLQSTDYYCTLYKDDRDGAILEKNVDNNWVVADICPVQPQRTPADTLYCRPYSGGSFIYVSVFSDDNCKTAPITAGVYRLKHDIYTDCIVGSLEKNKEVKGINPALCNTKHMLYSDEFTIK